MLRGRDGQLFDLALAGALILAGIALIRWVFQ